MAGGAIVRNRAPFGAHVIAVVTPETSGGIGMSEIVRIGTPGHSHFRKNIVLVNSLHGRNRSLKLAALGVITCSIHLEVTHEAIIIEVTLFLPVVQVGKTQYLAVATPCDDVMSAAL